jgi:hypothetical protein
VLVLVIVHLLLVTLAGPGSCREPARVPGAAGPTRLDTWESILGAVASGSAARGEECSQPGCEACPELELVGPLYLREGLDASTAYFDLVLDDCVKCWSCADPASGADGSDAPHPATCCGAPDTGYLSYLLSERRSPLAPGPIALAGEAIHAGVAVPDAPLPAAALRWRRWNPLGPDHPLRFGRVSTRDVIGPVTGRRQVMRLQLQF